MSGEGIDITHSRAMQIIEPEHGDWNFYWPATGSSVFTDDGEPNAPTRRGSWSHDVTEEPMHLAEKLQLLWQAQLKAQAAAEEGADVVGLHAGCPRAHEGHYPDPAATMGKGAPTQ